MPIAFRSFAHVIGTGQNATVAEPSGAAQNDVFVAVAICTQSSSLTRPAGWTQLWSGTSGTTFRYDISYIVRGASSPDRTWVLSASVFREIELVAFSGAHTTNPINVSADGGASTGANPNAPAVTTTVADAMVLALGANWSGANPWGAPSGYTLRSFSGLSDVPIASKLLGAAATEDPAAFTGGAGGGTTTQWAGTIALAPASTGNAFEQAVNDTLALADAITRDAARTTAENLALADSTAHAAETSVADSLTVADSVSKEPGVSLADTLGVSDSVAMQVTAAVSDILAVADSLAMLVSASRADSLALADAVDPVLTSSAANWEQTVNDTLALADLVEVGLGLALASRIDDSLSGGAAVETDRPLILVRGKPRISIGGGLYV